MTLEAPDRAAIERVVVEPERLRAVYQPIVDLSRGVTCGFEALARFQKGHPGAWFTEAAKLGLAGRLEAAVVHAVLGSRARLPEGCFLALNVTPTGALDPSVRDAFRSYGGLDSVVVEVSEQMTIGSYDELARALAEVRDRGGRVAVDAAGFDELILLNPDFLKIDRAIISGVDSDPRKRAVVRALAGLATDIGARAVAEGIETEAELGTVIDLGVPLGQGFAFGHGVPVMSAHSLGLEGFIRERAAARS